MYTPSVSEPATRDGSAAEPERGFRDFGWTDNAPHSVRYLHGRVLDACMPLDSTSRVLDLGCGNGHLLAMLREKGAGPLVGVDIAPDGVDRARKRCPDARIECVLAGTDLLQELREEAFDLVVSTEVVEHVFDPDAWAATCYAAVRTGGRLVCSTPYHAYAKNLALCLLNRWDRHHQPLKLGGHIKFFSTDTLASLLARHGFEDIRFSGAGRVPYLWKSMIATARRP